MLYISIAVTACAYLISTTNIQDPLNPILHTTGRPHPFRNTTVPKLQTTSVQTQTQRAVIEYPSLQLVKKFTVSP